MSSSQTSSKETSFMKSSSSFKNIARTFFKRNKLLVINFFVKMIIPSFVKINKFRGKNIICSDHFPKLLQKKYVSWHQLLQLGSSFQTWKKKQISCNEQFPEGWIFEPSSKETNFLKLSSYANIIFKTFFKSLVTNFLHYGHLSNLFEKKQISCNELLLIRSFSNLLQKKENSWNHLLMLRSTFRPFSKELITWNELLWLRSFFQISSKETNLLKETVYIRINFPDFLKRSKFLEIIFFR